MVKKVLVCLLLTGLLKTVGMAQGKAIYNMFLEQPVPANGTTVLFNAPVLRWPYQKGKQVRYEVQLSQHKNFESLAGGVWYWHYKVSGKEWSAVQQFLLLIKQCPWYRLWRINFFQAFLKHIHVF